MKKIHSIIKLFITIASCMIISTSAMQPKFASHLLMTILDDSEPVEYRSEIDAHGNLKGNLGMSATQLWAALLEETGIIIVNSSVVRYLMQYIATFEQAAQIDGTQYSNLFSLPQKIAPQNWLKKKISDELYVLVPKKYAATLPTYTKLKNLDLSKSSYTLEELALGIKLKNKTDISDKDFMSVDFHKKKDEYGKHKRESIIEKQGGITTITYELSWISDHFIKNINNIFITQQEYQKNSPSVSDAVPRFIVATFGHGSTYRSIEEKIKELQKYSGPKVTEKIQRLQKLYEKGKRGYTGGQVAGLNSKDFGTFAKFCENNLVVKLIFLNTCYGAEVNLHEALVDTAEDITGELPKLSFSFPIISGAFSTAKAYTSVLTKGGGTSTQTTYGPNKKIIKQEVTKKPKYLAVPVFQKFLDVLNTSTTPNHALFIDALQHIYLLYTQTGAYNNIPMIKEGSQPWQPLLAQGTYFTIDQQMVQKQGTQPLTLSNKVDLVFPDVFYTPFPLIMSASKMPTFISKTAGDAGHEFATIKASNFKFSDFIKAFFTIPDLADTKAFFIKNLEVMNKNGTAITLNDILIINYARRNEPIQKLVFWTDSSKQSFKTDFDMFLNNQDKTKTFSDFKKPVSDIKEFDGFKNKFNFDKQPTPKPQPTPGPTTKPGVTTPPKPEPKPTPGPIPTPKPVVTTDTKAVDKLGAALKSIA